MLFKPEHIDLVVMGRKTQTRRVCKHGEILLPYPDESSPMTVRALTNRKELIGDRTKWQIGRTYAVQPGRGKPGAWWLDCSTPRWGLPGTTREAVGTPYTVGNEFSKRMGWQPLRIRITSIRQERLQDISKDDVVAEGVGAYTFAAGILSENPPDPRWKFIERWDTINTRAGDRWADNPLVWVLDFELAQESEA